MGRFFRPNDEPVPGYKLVEWIGSGQFGQVWKAAGPGGVPVAMKIIESAGSVEGRKELRALRLLKNIRYNSLVPLIGFWLKDENDQLLDEESLDSAGLNDVALAGMRATQVAAAQGSQTAQLFIAMGLGEKTLFHRMAECQQEGLTGIPVGELITYMQDAADAIDYLNKKHNIIHCDIKPQNILIISERAQVCDFGLAKAIGNIRATVGGKTLGYSAPEVDRGEGPGHATDQYSLAASYYELRTGHLPFHEDDARSEYTVVKAKCEGRLDLSRVTDAERLVLQQAMAPDPNNRFAYCRKFIRSLFECFPDHEAVGMLNVDRDLSIYDSDPGAGQPAVLPSMKSSDAFTQTIVLSDSTSGSAGSPAITNLAITSTNASRETKIPKDTKPEARAPVQPAESRRLWPIVVTLAALAAGAGGFAAYKFGLFTPPSGGNVREAYAALIEEHDYSTAAKLLTKNSSSFEGNDWLQLIREWSELGNTDAAVRNQIQQTFPSNDIGIPEVANELRAIQERWLQRDGTALRETRQLVDQRKWPAYAIKEKELEPILSWLNAVSDGPLKDAAQQIAWQFEVDRLRRDAFLASESIEAEGEDNWSKLIDRADDLIAKAPTVGAALAASDLANMTLQLRQIKVRGRLENKSLRSDLAARTAMIGEVVALGGQDGNALGEPEFEPALEKFRASLMEQVGAIFKKADRTEAEDRLMGEAQKLIPSFATFIEYATKYAEFKADVAAERFAQARAGLQKLRELRGLEKPERDKIELAGRLLEWIDPEGKSSPEFSQFLADLSAAAKDDASQGEWADRMATGVAAQAQQWLASDEARANAWTEELLKPAEGEDAIKLQPRLLPLKRILIGNRLARGLFAAEQKVGDLLEPLNALEPETLNSLPLQIAWNEARLSQPKPDLRDIQSRLEKLQKDLPRESDPSLASYYDYVVALTQRAQDGDSSQATKNMLAALSTAKTVTGAKWSDNNERREQVLQILVQQMEKLAPNNSWFLDPNRQISQELRDLAESADTLATGLPEKNL
ncbi:MAG: Serine/threonine-protein kinase StkP, partial [Planctomycetota bacterium]